MAKVLVTGGLGFIGANLVSILDSGDHQIVIFDNFSSGKVEHLTDGERHEVIKGDIRDVDALDDTLAQGFDAVIHLAAYGSVVDSVASPEENFSINVEGTFNVLNGCKKANIKKIVFASTGGALIGNATPPVSENSLPRPISPYGASKLAGEGYCSAFASAYGIDVVALRFANVIGPISWHKKGAVTAFIKAIMNGEPIKFFGDGTSTRDYLYVEDLCRGIQLALEAKLSGFSVFHIASGNEVSVKQLAEIVCEVSGKVDHPVEYFGKRPGEVERNFAEYSLAKSVLGFEPSYSLKQALDKTYKWYEEQK